MATTCGRLSGWHQLGYVFRHLGTNIVMLHVGRSVPPYSAFRSASLFFASSSVLQGSAMWQKHSGDEEIRTPDILLAKQALYQLSYVPVFSRFGQLKHSPVDSVSASS